jgi:hypothetical protein
MNELLQQLASLGPGIGAGIAGNGEALKAFMEGYQRTMAQLETHKRAQTRDQLDQQELQMRHQAMTQGSERQAAMDARAAEDQEWQNTSRKMEVAGAFNQAGAGAESVPAGESSIDALYRLLPPGTQTEMAPTRDAAMRGVGPQITSRQKGELKRWVQGELLKSRFVAENADSDPDITQAMPPRVRQLAESLTGQTSFRKSDILALTEVLEQAPPERPKPNPTEASLALDAAGGDPAKAFGMLNPPPKPEKPAKVGYRWLVMADGEPFEWPDDKPAPRGANPFDAVGARQAAAQSNNPANAEAVETAAEASRIAQALLKHPGLPGAFGVVDQYLPTLRQSTADAQVLRDALTSLLTLGNVGKLKGVLSNADMEILKRASTTIAAPMSDSAAIAELQRIVSVMKKITGGGGGADTRSGTARADPLGIRKGG